MNRTYLISEHEPHITECPPSGAAWQAGEFLHVEEREDGHYYWFSGVARDYGYAYESDDVGPFDTADEALEDALAYLEDENPEAAARLRAQLSSEPGA